MAPVVSSWVLWLDSSSSGYQVEILVCKLENVSSVVDVKYGDIPNGYIQTPPRVVGGCGKGDW